MTSQLKTMLAIGIAGLAATMAQANEFTGPYLGAETSYEFYPDDFNGPTIGAVAGYSLAAGDVLIGLEARYAKPFARNTTTVDLGRSVATTRVTLDHQIGAQLRLGYRLSDRVALFGTVGGERFDVNAVRSVAPKPNCTPAAQCAPSRNDFSFSEELITAGAEVEWRFADKWRARAGYRYADGDAYTRNAVTLALVRAF